jgi:predicted nucleic acid-binding protein
MAKRPVLVLDATPLISLGSAGSLEPVLRLDFRFVVADEVEREVVVEGRRVGAADASSVERFIREGRIERAKVRDRRQMRRIRGNPRLSTADAASLCLALELDARLVTDERDLRAAARALGAKVGGTLFLLASAVKAGRMTAAEAAGIAERMVERGWYCSPAVLKSFISLISGKASPGHTPSR